MLTNEDVVKLNEVFATKEEIKEMVAPLSTKEDINKVLNAMDAYAKKVDDYS